MNTELTSKTLLENTAGSRPVNTQLIAHAAQLGIEQSAAAQALLPGNLSGTGTASPAAAPSDNPSVVSVTGTMAHYASQYGLLAGGIVAVLIIGAVIVKKIVKRKK